ncbi:FtsK/SpoIIIE domain-containing protein [Oryzobacter sp. R7]|uniref:FtsK/SpoIIIE domain-containing protein n=1 Tax=Oryzobacter faecalis TaxID=3388656 RepID=UPI00398CB4C6
MELTLTVHVPRRRALPVDVVVRWAGAQTAAALGTALGEHLGHPVPTLLSGGRAVPPDALVGHPPLLHGSSVVVGAAGASSVAPPGARPDGPVLELVAVGGPDAGRSRELVPPGLVVGRSVPHGFSLDDDALSRRHAEVRVDASGVVVADAGSTNGVLVDGRPLVEPSPVDSGSTLVLGASTLRLRRRPGAGLPTTVTGDGRLVLRPVAGRAEDDSEVVVEAPRPPGERHRPRIPWLAALLPVPVAAVMAVVFGPQLLAFALLGPVLMLGTALGDRLGSGRSHRRAVAEHVVATAAARGRLDRLVAEEVVRLDHDRPDAAALLRRAELRLPGLWARSDLRVRVGHGEVATRVVWTDGTTRERGRAGRGPVVVDVSGGLAVVGPPEMTRGVLASVVGQLAVQCPPSRLRLDVADDEDPAWRWVARLPHAGQPPVPGSRCTASGAEGPSGAPPGVHPLGAGADDEVRRVLVVPSLGPVATDLVSAAAEAGWVVLLGAADAELVGAVGVVVDAQQGTVGDRAGRRPLVVDRVGPWWAERVSRALAPLVEDRADDDRALPGRVALSAPFDGSDPGPDLVAGRWSRSDGRPRAVVGRTADGPFSVDLVTDGPHVLVGGTTGSGKSEFLRTLVVSLAATLPPEDLALVLVDFKGGAAFGACADLPHVVGLVTDLDALLVERALSSLDAELRRRERLFAVVGAADLEAYRRASGRPEPLPRLVVVVDELKALVDEVPRFVDGLVRLAALGRSLGIHLVLATQRPSGALSPAVQANVNLRIAFRVRDRSDSVDVVEDPAAAAIHPGVPGRAVARGGDGILVAFQAALVADPGQEVLPSLRVVPSGGCPGTVDVEVPRTTEGSRDAALDRLVAALDEAARATGRPRPRSPWLAPLPDVFDPHDPDAPSGADGCPPVRAGLVDEPDRQRTTSLGPEDGSVTWLLSGGPGSGRTTATRALALAAASRAAPADLHLHVIAAGGALADLAGLPHCGCAMALTDRRAVRALIGYLSTLVARRRSSASPDGANGHGGPTVFVLVDGWEQLVEATAGPWGDSDADALLTVLRDGASVGVRGIVTGGRALLQPNWSALGATTVVLGRVDPLDAALTGLRAGPLPVDPPRGRGVRVGDSRQVHFAHATAATTAQVAAARPAQADTTGGRAPWRYLPLPESVTRPARRRPSSEGNGDTAVTGRSLGLGLRAVADGGAASWRWVPERDGPRLLVAGPPRSGRTTTLRSLAEAVLDSGHPAVLVSRATRGQADDVTARLRVVTPDEVEEFVALRRGHPDLAVLVDDAELLDDAPLLPLLREHATLLGRDPGLLVVATSSDGLASRFRGLDVEVARHRFALLLMPSASDGAALGQPRLPDVLPVPGRGLVVGGGTPPREVQVYQPRGSVASGTVDLGAPVGDPLRGERDERGRQGEGDEAPAQEAQPALDHAATDREEQDTPHDRRGLRPGTVAQPAAGQHPEGDAERGDEEGRHRDPGRVAALPHGELVEVEGCEPEEGQRLSPDEDGGDAAGAA